MLTIVSDLFLTDSFLIKGQVENKYTRLSQLLDEYRKFHLKIRNATLVDLGTQDRIQTPLLHINVDEIILAHEFLDNAGDPLAAQLADDSDNDHRVRVFYTGNLNVEISGNVRPNSYEAGDRATRRFFVMKEPEVRGLNFRGDQDLKLLKDLPYAILNKSRVSYIYDFN